MKIKSVSAAAFFNPRALLGFGLGTLGLLLGLVAFIALPKQSALATPAPCTNVVYTFGGGEIEGAVYVTMESHNTGFTTPCTIYYNVAGAMPNNPTHASTIYTEPHVVYAGQIRYFKAFGHALGANPEDSGVTSQTVNNSGGGGN